MSRLPPCVIVLGLATPAGASPIEPEKVQTTWEGLTPDRGAEQLLGEMQLELAPRRDVMVDIIGGESQLPYYRFAGFSQLTGGGRAGGDVGAGAAFAMSGLGCDLLAGSVHGRFRPFDDGGQAAGEASYSICLSEVFLSTTFDGKRGIGVAPGLDARRSLWSRRYDLTYDRIKIGFGEWWRGDESDPHRHTLATIAIGHGTTTQTDGFEERTIKELDLDFALYRYRHTAGFELEAITLTSDAMKAGTDNKGGIATAFMPVRLRYETDEMYIAARGGWGWTGGQVTASGSTQVNDETVSSWSETIDGEGLPNMTTLVGDLEVGARRGRYQASANIARAFYPTFDGNVAREARVSGAFTYVAGRSQRTKLTLSPFAARNRVWTRDAGSSRDISAGASLHVGRELARQLRVDAIGEAGVSPYARLDGDRLPVSTLGGQVLVAVSGRVSQ